MIWNDGSERTEVPDLSRYFTLKHARLVETNYGIKGGPDAAIRFGLRRLLKGLGYDYIGLLENDILFGTRLVQNASVAFRCGGGGERNRRSRVRAWISKQGAGISPPVLDRLGARRSDGLIFQAGGSNSFWTITPL